jgi:hypothetical protein
MAAVDGSAHQTSGRRSAAFDPAVATNTPVRVHPCLPAALSHASLCFRVYPWLTDPR